MIVFCHLLNDNSGSPRVLRSAIAALARQQGLDRLYLGSGGRGILERAPVKIRRYWYRRSRYRFFTLFTYLASQVMLYIRLSRERDIQPDAIVYVNTLLPFAAALWGRQTGRKVLYHLHEVSVTPWILRRILVGIASWTAHRIIYVSRDHRSRLPIQGVPAWTIPNPIDCELYTVGCRTHYAPRRAGHFTALMVTSPRDFKGVPEFLELATNMAARRDCHFVLVLNADESEIAHYFQRYARPDNVSVYARIDDLQPYYATADVVLNLSRPDLCVETFGLSIAEAMAFGVPTIAPPVGGPAEIMTDGDEGFLVDCRDTCHLTETLARLADNPSLCLQLSRAARKRAAAFTHDRFAAELGHVMEGLKAGNSPR